MPLQVMHAPQEVPVQFSDLYPQPKYDMDYAIMNGMASMADAVLGNITVALQKKGMWENTLLVYTSDNGGPAGRLASGHSGNNWPLRGGKTNFFEGGVRVSSFLGGGGLPASIRGQHRSGYMYGRSGSVATKCGLLLRNFYSRAQMFTIGACVPPVPGARVQLSDFVL